MSVGRFTAGIQEESCAGTGASRINDIIDPLRGDLVSWKCAQTITLPHLRG